MKWWPKKSAVNRSAQGAFGIEPAKVLGVSVKG
jgi:hypothetical protein